MSTGFQAPIWDGGCLPDGQASVVKQFNRMRNGISAHWINWGGDYTKEKQDTPWIDTFLNLQICMPDYGASCSRDEVDLMMCGNATRLQKL